MSTWAPSCPQKILEFLRFSLCSFFCRLALLALLAAGIFFVVNEHNRSVQCQEHLRMIYRGLEQYEIERGALPHATFFPDDPKQDSDSLPVILSAYCSAPDLFVCLAAPRACQERGLCYIWNVKLNGRKIADFKEPVWMLTEINALSDQVPAPHWRSYHVLYSDGTVRALRRPPDALR